MSLTRPTGEQLRFHSSKTGTHILDDYLEAVEAGSRTLPDLIAELFDDISGDLKAFNFRLNNDAIEYQVGTGPWTAIHDYSAFRQEVEDWARKTGATVDGSEYSSKEYAIGTTVPTGSAKTHADAAAVSETNAATSKTNAAASEAAAATSETNAASSETAAATSASNAATSETSAATSETNASNSASAAATSETNAATSETNAASSASAAATSETNSASSASAASTSETNAVASEANAATSETNAAQSATEAADSAASIDLPDSLSGTAGKALQVKSDESGYEHVDRVGSASDIGLGNVTNDAQLKKASNLNDLPNKTTARSNLGLGTQATKNQHIAGSSQNTNNGDVTYVI